MSKILTMEEPKNSSSQFYQGNAGKIVLGYHVILCITLRRIDSIIFLPLNSRLEREVRSPCLE